MRHGILTEVWDGAPFIQITSSVQIDDNGRVFQTSINESSIEIDAVADDLYVTIAGVDFDYDAAAQKIGKKRD